jgi:hypothetical protein
MWQESTNNPYGASSSHGPYYNQPPVQPLQFYPPSPDQTDFYPTARPSLEGNLAAQGSISQHPSYGGNIQVQGPWWTAFGTGGFEGEPPLLQGGGKSIVLSTDFGMTPCQQNWASTFRTFKQNPSQCSTLSNESMNTSWTTPISPGPSSSVLALEPFYSL